MLKHIYISLIVLLGLFLIPGAAYACSKSVHKTEKSCRNKEVSKTKTAACCDNNHKDKKSHNGGGECNHCSCHCPSLSFSVGLPVLSSYPKKSLPFAEKQSFPNIVTSISSGYYSIWLPPKIS